MLAEIWYRTSDFADGVNIIGDGLDYEARAGLQMTYSFTSGGFITKDISAVRARDGGAFDQWNWKGGDFGGLLFQANDPTDSSFELSLPYSFDDMHTLFLTNISNFAPSENGNVVIEVDSQRINILFDDEGQTFSITAVNSPAQYCSANDDFGLTRGACVVCYAPSNSEVQTALCVCSDLRTSDRLDEFGFANMGQCLQFYTSP